MRTLLRILAALAVIVLVGMAAGAGWFFGRSDLSQKLDGNRVIFGDVSRRAIYVKVAGEQTKLCAEPPPDAGDNTSDQFKTLVDAALKLPENLEGSAKAEAERQRQVTVQSLLTRSQGLQNLRDILYRACEAELNGTISSETYVQIFKAALASTTALMTIEVITNKLVVNDKQMDPKVANNLLNFAQVMFAQ